jgi:formate dehydrogenase major subunit
LSGLPIEAPKQEFLSKKDNFRKQEPAEYIGKFENQKREEMPTLDPKARMNFDEVELGYASEEVAKHEASRCLECGCTEYFSCDLKKYSNEYNAEQKKFEGHFEEHPTDFRHPYIEIDNNKCILCARCVRICKEVVGANALGLVNRGFSTYVAPSMGNSLQETNCESCGLCISTCPTGAITENVDFKVAPVRTKVADTICNYCSVGCEITLHHKSNFVMKITGKEDALVNKDGNICRFAKFGYSYLNDNKRITKPLFKKNGKFEEVTFAEAYKIIVEKIKAVSPDENSFYAGARLSNEEMYLTQKLARYAVGTNNIRSFLYMERGKGYMNSSKANVPFVQIGGASKVYLFGSEINTDHAVVGFMINNAQVLKHIKVELVTTNEKSSMEHKVDKVHKVKSYYHLAKAMNFYLLQNKLENAMFINDNCKDFEVYKQNLLAENFNELLEKAGFCCKEGFEDFVKDYNNEMNAVLIFSDKEVSGATSQELFNLAMITGKLGKTSNGIISLKEKNNSSGIFDMGICPTMGVGGQSSTEKSYIEKVKKAWKTSHYPETIITGHSKQLDNGEIKNMFVFGEDPVGCAKDKKRVEKWFDNAKFVVVQDYFMTETAQKADIILPASLPIETDGTFTNTQHVVQELYKQFTSKVERLSYQQTHDLIEKFGINEYETINDVLMEAISLIPQITEKQKFEFVSTEKDNANRLFDYGCDSLVKRFEEEFKGKLEK